MKTRKADRDDVVPQRYHPRDVLMSQELQMDPWDKLRTAIYVQACEDLAAGRETLATCKHTARMLGLPTYTAMWLARRHGWK